jgi:hypothetical protein
VALRLHRAMESSALPRFCACSSSDAPRVCRTTKTLRADETTWSPHLCSPTDSLTGISGALWLVIGLLALSMMLLLGALTPVVSLFAVTAECVIRATPGSSLLIVLILHTFALMLLGPGAYSLPRWLLLWTVSRRPPARGAVSKMSAHRITNPFHIGFGEPR